MKARVKDTGDIVNVVFTTHPNPAVDEHPAVIWHKNIDGDLPKKSGRYLVMAQNGFCHTCKYDTGSRYWDTIGYQSNIAYWMEIPELPTK